LEKRPLKWSFVKKIYYASFIIYALKRQIFVRQRKKIESAVWRKISLRSPFALLAVFEKIQRGAESTLSTAYLSIFRFVVPPVARMRDQNNNKHA